MFAFGIVAFEIATGEQPWAGLNEASLLMAIVVEKRRPTLSNEKAEALSGQLAQQCWADEPDDRPTFAELSATLEEQANAAAAMGRTRETVGGLSAMLAAELAASPARDTGSRFAVEALVFGRMADAALGIHHFLCISSNQLRASMLQGLASPDAISREAPPPHLPTSPPFRYTWTWA